MLCQHCEESRFPKSLADKDVTCVKESHPHAPSQDSAQGQQPDAQTSATPMDGDATHDPPTDRPTIVDALLSFVIYALQSATVDNVKNAVTGHFTSAEILTAKDLLWSHCKGNEIGDEMPRRRESTTRSLEDAHVQDIICALSKLDKADKIPNILLNAHSLGRVPKWHAEDLNSTFIADRLLRIENKVTVQQEVIDRNAAEIIILKEKLDASSTYAAVAGRPPMHEQLSNSNLAAIRQKPTTVPLEKEPDTVKNSTTGNLSQPGPAADSNEQVILAPNSENSGNTSNVYKAATRGSGTFRRGGSATARGSSFTARGTGSTHGVGSSVRGGRVSTRGRGGTVPKYKGSSLERGYSLMSLVSALTDTSEHGGSEQWHAANSGRRDSGDEFQYPSYAARKSRQKEKRRQHVITGKRNPEGRRFRGAPEPNRDLFIFRVHTDTDVEDIKEHVLAEGYDARDIKCVSHPDAMWKSFRLTVPLSQFNSLLSDDFPWPDGVRVRQFIPPKRQPQDSWD